MNIFEQGKANLPSFMKFFRQNMTLELLPTRIAQYDIMVELVSLRGMKSIYKFNVEILANETAIYDKVV